MEQNTLDETTENEDGTVETKDKKNYPPIKETVTTEPGQNLIDLAFQNNLMLKTLLEHPDNEHLLDQNIDPENTQTDVTVNIPEESKAKLSDSTGNFGIKIAGKKAWFSVRIKSINGDDLKEVPFCFRCIRNKVLTRDILGRSGRKNLVPEGQSNGDGVITCEVPFNTKYGELAIWPYGNKEDSRSLHYFIEFAANGPEGTDTGDRFRTANGGLSSINPLKKAPLSETARNLFENPGQLIPYENAIPDNHRQALRLTLLKDRYDHELKEIDRELKEASDTKTVYALGERRTDLAVCLACVIRQLQGMEKDVEKLKSYLSEWTLHDDFMGTLKVNDDFRTLVWGAYENKVQDDMLEKIVSLLPLDNAHVDFLGGISVFEQKLDKETQRLERIDRKLENPGEDRVLLEETKSKTQWAVSMLGLQIDAYNQNKTGDDEELIELGTIEPDDPGKTGVATLIRNSIHYGPEWEGILSSRLNADKPFDTLKKGDTVSIHPRTLELVWGDQEPAPPSKDDKPIPGYEDFLFVSRKGYVTRFDRIPEADKLDKISVLTLPENPLSVYFKYNDSVGGIARNSTIIYKAFDEVKDSGKPDIPKKTPLAYPIGIGMTDSSGRLVKCHDVSAIEDLFTAAKQHAMAREILSYATNLLSWRIQNDDEENEVSGPPLKPVPLFHSDSDDRVAMTYPDTQNAEEVKKIREEDIAKGRYNRASMNYFSPKVTYGFFCYPAYQGSFKTLPFDQLVKSGAAVKGKIEDLISQDGPDANLPLNIKVFCPLAQWDARIREQITTLQQSIEFYEATKQPHYQNIYLLSAMQDIIEVNGDYPFWGQNKTTVDNKTDLLNALYELEADMIRQMEFPEDNPEDLFRFKARKNDVKKQAKSLYDIMICKEFRHELKRYFSYITTEDALKKLKPGRLFPPGPDMETENNWALIFETLGEAYAILAIAEKSYQAFKDEDIAMDFSACVEESGIDTFLGQCLDVPADMYKDLPSGESMKTLVKEAKAKLTERKLDDCSSLSSLIVKGFNDYLKAAQGKLQGAESAGALKGIFGLITSTPGPHCVLQELLNAYQMAFLKQASDKTKHIALLMLTFKTMGFFESNDSRAQGQLTIIRTLCDPRARYGGTGTLRSFLYHQFFPHKKDGLYDDPEDLGDSVYAKIGSISPGATAIYRTAFTVMNISCLAFDVIFTDDTYYSDQERILHSLSTWGNVALQAHCVYFLNNYYRQAAGKEPIKGLKMATAKATADMLSVMLLGVSSCILWHEAEKLAEHNGDTRKIFELRLSASLQAAQMIGFAMKSVSRLCIKVLGKMGLQMGILATTAGTGQFLLTAAALVDLAVFVIQNHDILIAMARDPESVLRALKQSVSQGTYKMIKGMTALTIHLLWREFCKTKQVMFQKAWVLSDDYEPPATFIDVIVEPEQPYLETEWGKKSKELIDKIEDLSSTNFVYLGRSDTSFKGLLQEWDKGVSWSPCSWHAIIPLYSKGLSELQIQEIVMIPAHEDPDEMKDPKREPFMDTVGKIIGYYEYVKEHLEELDKEFTPKPENLVERYEPVMTKILTELESGSFNPATYIEKGIDFHEKKQWGLPHFTWAPNPNGIIDYEELTTAINELEAEYDKVLHEQITGAVTEALQTSVNKIDNGLVRFFLKGQCYLGIKKMEYGFDVLEKANIVFRSVKRVVVTEMDDNGMVHKYKKLEKQVTEQEEM